MARNSEDHGGLLSELGTGANEFWLENDAEVIETAGRRQIITTNQPGKPGQERAEKEGRRKTPSSRRTWQSRGAEER